MLKSVIIRLLIICRNEVDVTLTSVRYLILVLGFLIPDKAASQTKIDSLLTLMETTVENSDRVKIYAALAQEYSNLENFKVATNFLHNALDLMDEQKDTRDYIWKTLALSNAYLMQRDIESAKKYAQKAAIMAQQAGFKDAEARAYLNLGSCFYESGDFEEAEKKNLVALNVSMGSGDTLYIAYAYNNLAMVFRHQQKYAQALQLLYTSLQLKQAIGSGEGTISTLGNLGRVYKDQKNWDSAVYMIKKAHQVACKSNNDFYMAHTSRNLAELYFDMAEYDKSQAYADSALALSKKCGYDKLQIEVYELISKIFTEKGDFKNAFRYYQRYSKLNDTVEEILTKSRIEEMERLYDFGLKEIKIQSLELQNTRLLRNLYVSVSLVLVIAVILIYLRQVKLVKARRELKASESKFRDLAENASEVIWQADSNLNFTYLSPGTERILGYFREEFIDKNASGFITEEAKILIIDLVEKYNHDYYSTGQIPEPELVEIEGIHKNGSRVWVEFTTKLIVNEQGQVAGYQGIVRNISERKAAEQEKQKLLEDLSIKESKLQDALLQMNTVFDTIPGGISVIDLDYNIISINNRLCEIHGVKDKKGVIGKKCFEVYRCREHPCESCALDKVVGTKANVVSFTTPEEEKLTGGTHRIYSSPMFDPDGRLVGMVEAVMDISDLKRAEMALEESEKKFEQFFNEIPDAIFITHFGGARSGEIVNVNPAAEEQTGYSRKELLRMNVVSDISVDKEPKELRRQREQLLLKNKIIEFVEKKRKKDGAIIWTEVVIHKIRLNSEDLALSVSRDITDRKIAEEKLKISESKNLSLLSAIPDLIFVLNDSGIFMDSHAPTIGDLYLPREQFIGKPITEILPGEIASMTLENISNVLKTGQTIIYDYKLPINDEPAYFEARMAKSNEHEVMVVVRNITERKIAEIEIRQREEKYRSIFANSPVGIFTFNHDSVIIDCNENFIKIIGSSRSQLIGFNLLKQLKDNKLRDAVLETFKKGSSYYEGRYQSVTAEKITPVKLFLKAIYNDDVFMEGIGIVEDITDQKEYEKEILLAKEKAELSDRMKSSFMATMSHEIRTPLNAVIGFSDMIDSSLPLDQILEFIKLINKSGKHLHSIVEDIFDVVSIDSGEIKVHPAPVRIRDKFLEIYHASLNEREKAGKADLAIRLSIPEELYELVVITDFQKLNKVLLHLIKNAVKFTKTGEIEFGCRIDTTNPGHHDLLIFVKDTGIGIPKEKHTLIFELFRQGDESSTRVFEGTGLGLTITKKLVELLGGQIWLESEPGFGSTFFFTLPCQTEVPVKTLKTKGTFQNELHENGKSLILIAEDDDTNYQLFELLLRRSNVDLIRVKNGLEAVETVSINPLINLVLMDLYMPVMNGYEAIEFIKKLRHDLPVVALSASSDLQDEERAIGSGCDDFIQKPIDNKIFFGVIDKYLKSR